VSRRAPQILVALVALFGIVAVVLGIRHDGSNAGAPSKIADEVTLPTASPTDAAERASRAFLDAYVGSDGRVHRDDANDTVSEGQAYAMLLAVATSDSARFASVWDWTKANLLQADGSLAWHWVGGKIVDANAATDADIDAARALLLAADRFGQPTYRADGLALGTALLTNELVDAGAGPVLVAGPWATTSPATLNPSYTSPEAFAQLAAASGDPKWSAISTASVAVLDSLTKGGTQLPSDWAAVQADGSVLAIPPPGGGSVSYSYDAFRTLPRLAESCDAASRKLAAALDAPAQRTVDQPSAVANLDGSSQSAGTNPVFLVAAAAAAHAAGDGDRADELLDAAERSEIAAPSYYLAAWVALGRVVLDTTTLGGCGPHDIDTSGTATTTPIAATNSQGSQP